MIFFDKSKQSNTKSHNQPSEQIRSDFGLEIAQDQVLRSSKQQREALIHYLGENNCAVEEILGRKLFIYKTNEKKYIILHKAISYLGNPHPIFKKRIQMPRSWQEFCNEAATANIDYDIRFVGIYHYQNNVIFVDFQKDTYLQHGLHNSSAHVYTNDLYQAVRNGVFRREDQCGNNIYSIRAKDFADYLIGAKTGDNELFELFAKFNNGFSFGQWLYAVDKIKEMHGDNWRHWQQTEWAGWFLEYKFNKFTIDNNTLELMKYVGTDNKTHKEGTFDFDIWFGREQFYGDLKASDIKKTFTPGNDQESFVECINKHDRFWYVIYEHETIKDSEETSYKATIERNQYIRSVDPNYKNNDMSYYQRMKNSVRFMKMTILELNNVTFRDVLTDFNQGKQPDGKSRQKKFLIKKKDMDKYVVYRYTYKQA
ncbi:MAG: hypothetical protein IKT96_06005 [Paludibacteraceae bacterium]|nr:hypothetical protein [Paludibacteraceae bacterium]